ncbi:MAG: FAD-dependent oxidoreductase [Candidatus Cloacimonetes bacterium]|nr:FAD-dependent oxidoreductase [Candidatus Cloacimonadota bacterium]MCF7813521.1 FAD-dependent oxidoreductase [Candidatus Cloacimonadota bacterium]MCF7868695.1 FAD-dependent oxidoreductase [Candidatus Cloacimonadota bacterium]MCF7884661.1 FAD-dependent oxidoreductase [Candidatus Cloacimonadota bacterium]
MSLKDILSPFYVWKRAFEKPYTTPNPLQDRPGAERYRGFHQNDLEKCIGCGSCEAICQNAAIDMVPVEGIETTKKDSGLRPQIDYGRCCWCALCVDICTTDSLKMSNDYTWVDTDADVFRFVPGAETKKWDKIEEGYQRSDEYKLLLPDQIKMPMMTADESIQSFLEVVKGYSKNEAIREAERCVECGLCVASCPAHMDIPEYIKAIREDNLEEALQLLYKTNPMPSTCGRICTHLCEGACSIGVKGEALAIRWLKRYIVDQIEPSKFKEILKDEFKPNNKKIAIIGAGPAGLSAAYYLITTGYDVTVFEANEKAGGMIRYGVPEYRMPYDKLDEEIAYIENLGVKIKYNYRIGEKIKFQDLQNDFEAIFISPGMWNSIPVNIVGEELPQVLSGIQLLNKVTNKEKIELGKKVGVIGGGNSAMDAARTARRLGAEVDIYYRRRIEDMPADDEEIDEAQEEGIKFYPQTTPLEIKKDGKGIILIWGKNKMKYEEGKRPKPILIKGESFEVKLDSLIIAIGQNADFTFLPEKLRDKIETKWDKIVVDENGKTNIPKVFSGGDASNYKADAISAIADGHRAAMGIDKFLNSGKNVN